MSLWGIVIWLAVGALIGWIASLIMQSTGGFFRNIVMGILGSLLGGWIASLLGVNATGLGSILIAVGGACLLIWIVSLFTGKKKRKK